LQALYYPYLIDTEIHIAMKEGECAFGDGIEQLTDVLTRMARELDDLAESLETGDDEQAERIASPLDRISAILNGAAEKIRAVSMEQAEEVLKSNK
jgi:hypothetical protein